MGTMSLTQAQLTALKVDIKAAVDSAVVNALAAKDTQAIANAYNAPSNPAVSVWIPTIPIVALIDAIVWSEFATLSVAQQNAYQAMIQPGMVDATQANIRGGFSSIFSGKTSLTNLTAAAQQTATRFEALNTTSSVSSVFGYSLTPSDVANAIFNPDGTVKA